jgi:hypothetical protein
MRIIVCPDCYECVSEDEWDVDKNCPFCSANLSHCAPEDLEENANGEDD